MKIKLSLDCFVYSQYLPQILSTKKQLYQSKSFFQCILHRGIMKRGYSPSPKPSFRNTRSKFFTKKQSDISKTPTSHHQENTGQFWKNKGNEAYAKGYFETAIQHYSKAIELNDGQSIYYSNRAKCYSQLKLTDKALKDAQSACELDEKNIKAHYICGCILAQAAKKDQMKISKAQNRLKKALRLCDTLKKSQFIDSISIKLFRLRKLKYLKQQQSRTKHSKQIHDLIKKSYVQSLITKQQQDKMLKMEQNIHGIRNKQIPDHMNCKITLQIMEDPVTTEAGFTYQKSALDDHFRKNGMIQPITRQPIKGQNYSNQALKLAINEFMQQNPWAFQYTPDESYHNIIF